MKINQNMASLPAGYLFAEVARRVREYEKTHTDANLLRLGIGDVTRPLAPTVAKAFGDAAAAMGTKEGFHGYAPDFGYDFLLKAIADHDYRQYGIDINEGDIFVSDGAKTDTSSIQELFSADCRIAVTDPVYPVYVDSNAMAGRLGKYENGRWSNLVYLPCNAENGFVPALPTEKVDVLYLCYPNNPTGTVLTRDQLKVFVDWALENEALIIYDSAYKAFIRQDDVPQSIFEIEGARKCAIECCSFSKTAGFTGTRCAYTVLCDELMGKDENGEDVSIKKLWKRRMSTKQNGVSYPVQCAAAAVFTEQGLKEINECIDYYLENCRIIREGLIEAGFTVFGGINSPYVWMKTPDGMSSWEFFDYLLDKAHVVGTPGEGFGPSGEGYFRLTAFNTKENTIEAVKRVIAAVKG